MEPMTILLVTGVIGLVIIGYFILDSGASAGQKRVDSIGASGKDLKKPILSFMKVDDASARRKAIEASLGELEEEQKSKKKKTKLLKSKLLHADLKMDPKTFTIISGIIAVIVCLPALVLGANPLIALGMGFAVGFGFPRWVLNVMITRRQKKFIEHFSDSLDIIVRGVRTGLPLNDCMGIIAHESPEPIKGEFRRLIEAESVGVPLETSLERMVERMPLPELSFFGIVLSIQRSTGGNLGESLGNLSNVLRQRKLLREKIKALSAEAKMSAMIIGALPPVVMALVTVSAPDYMVELYTTPTGHRNLMISAVMMALGIFVMRKMINFKF